MTIELPDVPMSEKFTPEELRLELACALYARGRIGKVTASDLSGVDFFTFQRALGERNISVYSEQMLADDLQSLKTLFPQ